jgi:SHAQKYF class myb-like DNA-binding protein
MKFQQSSEQNLSLSNILSKTQEYEFNSDIISFHSKTKTETCDSASENDSLFNITQNEIIVNYNTNAEQHIHHPTGIKQIKAIQGKWTEDEHARFLEAIIQFGNNWDLVTRYIKTRNPIQARSHSQKFFNKIKLKLMKENIFNNCENGFSIVKKIKNYVKEKMINKYVREGILNELSNFNLKNEQMTKVIILMLSNHNEIKSEVKKTMPTHSWNLKSTKTSFTVDKAKNRLFFVDRNKSNIENSSNYEQRPNAKDSSESLIYNCTTDSLKVSYSPESGKPKHETSTISKSQTVIKDNRLMISNEFEFTFENFIKENIHLSNTNNMSDIDKTSTFELNLFPKLEPSFCNSYTENYYNDNFERSKNFYWSFE